MNTEMYWFDIQPSVILMLGLYLPLMLVLSNLSHGTDRSARHNINSIINVDFLLLLVQYIANTNIQMCFIMIAPAVSALFIFLTSTYYAI